MKRAFLAAAAVLLFALSCAAFVYCCMPRSQPEAETTAPAVQAAVVKLPTEPEPILPLPTIPYVPDKPPVEEDYTFTFRHAFVYSCGSGKLLYSHGDQHQRISTASLTKLMTAWVVLQHLDPHTVVTCGEETTWIDPASSVAWVSPGDRVTVEHLIQGMMMQSGNDAARAAAVAAGRVLAKDPGLYPSRAITVFMDEVNAQLLAHGITDTHFITPDGLDTEGHYTTAADMLAIARLAMEEPLILHYSGLTSATVMYENDETYTYQSTNALLHPQSRYYCADACGMKTGTTRKAGSCLMSLFYNGEEYILIGVFGCPQFNDRFADALQLYARYG